MIINRDLTFVKMVVFGLVYVAEYVLRKYNKICSVYDFLRIHAKGYNSDQNFDI